jgi:uncharacterized protein with PIN domain
VDLADVFLAIGRHCAELLDLDGRTPLLFKGDDFALTDLRSVLPSAAASR